MQQELDNLSVDYTYHSHSDACKGTVNKTCTITEKYANDIYHPEEWNSMWCGKCNDSTYHNSIQVSHSNCGTTVSYYPSCNRCDSTVSYTHTYSSSGYICDRNEGDIESATINFN